MEKSHTETCRTCGSVMKITSLIRINTKSPFKQGISLKLPADQINYVYHVMIALRDHDEYDVFPDDVKNIINPIVEKIEYICRIRERREESEHK